PTPTPAPPLSPVPATPPPPPAPGVTPAPVPAPPPAPGLSAKPISVGTPPPPMLVPSGNGGALPRHTVPPGDTYVSLSIQYYKDPQYARALAAWVKQHDSNHDENAPGPKPGFEINIPLRPEDLRVPYTTPNP